jgi:hypothetical protein
LNGVTAQHTAYVGTSTILLVLTGLILTALRGPASLFRIAMWGGVAVSVGVAAWCVLTVRRRWVDIAATAHLADHRGALTDRLATLIDLRFHPRPSRLAPVLVAQILALRQQWQPQRIAPRRVPRSVYAVIGALLALAFTAFVERRPPVPPPAATAGGDAAGTGTTSVSPRLLGGGAAAQASGVSALAGMPPPGGSPEGRASSGGHPTSGAPARGDASRTTPADGEWSGAGAYAPRAKGGQGDQEEDEQTDSAWTSLPDRLQDAIRRAFHAEAMSPPQELAARAEPETGDRAGTAGDPHRNQDAQRRAAAEPNNPDAEAPGSQKGSGPGSQTGSGKPKPDGQTAQQPSGDAAYQNFDGTSPAAGEGSSPGGLMDGGTGEVSTAGPAAPKTFKLTITSFLQAIEQKGTQPHQARKRVSTTGGAGTRAASQATLSERQLNDDALRKAEIPPEYEDIVRRVYSLRAEQ